MTTHDRHRVTTGATYGIDGGQQLQTNAGGKR
jgi:hypothetical protein